MIDILRKMAAVLVAALLLALPAMAEGETAPPEATDAPQIETVNVDFISSYQRANQPGMYIQIVLKDNTKSRMQTRLRDLIRDGGEAMGADALAGADAIIDSIITSTETTVGDLISITKGSSESPAGSTLRIPDEYLRSADFIAVADSKGRVMLVPVAEYDVELYDQVVKNAQPIIRSLLLGMLDDGVREVVDGVTDAANKSALNTSYDQKRSDLTIAAEEVESFITGSLGVDLGDGVTLGDALNVSSDMTIGGLGELEPVYVYEGDEPGAAAFKLTVNEGGTGFTGISLAETMSVDEIIELGEPGAQLWLDADKKIVYLKCADSWLSRDAGELTALIEERGGAVAEAETEEPPPEEADVDRIEMLRGAWLYLVIGLGVVIVVLLAVLMIAGRRRRDAAAPGAAEGESRHIVGVDYLGDDQPDGEDEEGGYEDVFRADQPDVEFYDDIPPDDEDETRDSPE